MLDFSNKMEICLMNKYISFIFFWINKGNKAGLHLEIAQLCFRSSNSIVYQ